MTIHAGDRRLVKDLCSQHLAELIKGTRPVRRGRPKGSTSAAAPTSARAKSAKKAKRARRTGRKAAAAA